jgi:hypothetical protein
MLSFQRLDVYRHALEFVSLVRDVVAGLPESDAEQLTRAAESVVRHIARNRYEHALSATTECVVLLDVLKLLGLVGDVCYGHGIQLLESVVANLDEIRSRSCRSPDA